MKWLKRLGKCLVKLAGVLAVAWYLFQQYRHRLLAQDQAYQEQEARAQNAGKKADKAREKAHAEIHEAAQARGRAQERIEQIDRETANDDAALGDVWGDWRRDRADRLRDD